MKRGPKPVDVGFLRQLAYAWAIALYRLRDGQPGLLAKIVRPGPWKPILTPIMEWNLFMLVVPEAAAGFPARSTEGEVVAVGVVFPEMVKHARQLVKSKKGWVLTPPMAPKPEMWERLKKACSVADVRQFARDLHKRYRMISVPQWRALRSRAQDLLRATQLPNYPKSDRQQSDDKRIQFWAKVLAGLMLGIAPATATKRLAHLPLPKGHDISRRWAEYATSLSNAHRRETRK